MLFFKRILTSAFLFVFLFIGLYIGTLVLGAAMAGAVAGSQAHTQATNFQQGYNEGYELGRKAGAEFSRQYKGLILVGSFGASVVLSLVLPFCGAFPWCRSKSAPPSLQ